MRDCNLLVARRKGRAGSDKRHEALPLWYEQGGSRVQSVGARRGCEAWRLVYDVGVGVMIPA